MEFQIHFVCYDGHAINIPSEEIGLNHLADIRAELDGVGLGDIGTGLIVGDTFAMRTDVSITITDLLAKRIGGFADRNVFVVPCDDGALNKYTNRDTRLRRDKLGNVTCVEYGHVYNKIDIFDAWESLGCPARM